MTGSSSEAHRSRTVGLSAPKPLLLNQRTCLKVQQVTVAIQHRIANCSMLQGGGRCFQDRSLGSLEPPLCSLQPVAVSCEGLSAGSCSCSWEVHEIPAAAGNEATRARGLSLHCTVTGCGGQNCLLWVLLGAA